MIKQKSLKLNMALNAVKGLMNVIFPLITFPYISKVLGVDNIGRYNFANSVINYFALFAALGISTYAIREGAKFREDKNAFKHFADEMFSINVISTLLSYAIFFALLIFVIKFHSYKDLLLILSIQIAFKTIGVEWVYSVYEEYAYITIRSIIFQVLSLVLMFVFVRSENDVCVYALITVISSVGSNILNFFNAKKFCRIGLTKNIEWKRHWRPIMILFSTAITVMIYVNSDTTILGFLCDDYTVGIYSVSAKVYSVVKTILSSVIVVSIPRLSTLLNRNNNEVFNIVSSDIYSTLMTITLPAITGIIILREQIVLLISDETFLDATSSLSLLSIAMLFCLGAYFWAQCILVPVKKEGVVFAATVVSAAANIILNFALVPIWKENAAALTTIIAECIVFLWCWHSGKKYVKIKGTFSTFWKALIGCAGIFIVSFVCKKLFGTGVLFITITIVGSVLIYGLIEITLKNEAAWSILNGVKKKLHVR